MFVATDSESLRRAKVRAAENRPEVRARSFGDYQVAGSRGNFYPVGVRQFGRRTGLDCACIAGQYGTPCDAPSEECEGKSYEFTA